MIDKTWDMSRMAISAALAGTAGFIGMLVGVKVNDAEIENLKSRLDRIEAKLDRLIEGRHPD